MNSNLKKPKRRILFVCLGNICRSPTAEAVFKRLVKENGLEKNFYIDSAGTSSNHTGEASDARSILNAVKRGYVMDHKARLFIAEDFSKFDRIICMDDSNYLNVNKLAKTEKDQLKIEKMAAYLKNFNDSYIIDPWPLGAEAFEHVLDLLEDACLHLLEQEEKIQK